MIRIQKLVKPGKRSGFHLPQGETTEVRGFSITNIKAGKNVFVDKFTKQKAKKAKKK